MMKWRHRPEAEPMQEPPALPAQYANIDPYIAYRIDKTLVEFGVLEASVLEQYDPEVVQRAEQEEASGTEGAGVWP